MASNTPLLTPVGRLVQGSLYIAQTTNSDGTPKVYKTGPKAGQPRIEYFFAVAFKKGAEQHWAQTSWGAVIWQTGHAAFPQGQGQAPTFAWKITDGDSTVPNKAGKKPCDSEGFAGHWVVAFSGGYAPSVWNADGSQELLTPDVVKNGYFVQVSGSVAGNDSTVSPGVYLNHGMVAFAAQGPEIQGARPNGATAGFGQSPLPTGATAIPATPMQAAMTPPPVVPVVPVVPAVGFVAPPALPPAPPAARQMTPKAGGATYESFIKGGWTDALMISNGMMSA